MPASVINEKRFRLTCCHRFNATTVNHFCYDRNNCNSPPSASDIQRFRDSLAACMQASFVTNVPEPCLHRLWVVERCCHLKTCSYALTVIVCCLQEATKRGFDLEVNMHVDDATKGGLGGWRNTLNFDPLQPYSGVR
jgi:hypothetical protein